MRGALAIAFVVACAPGAAGQPAGRFALTVGGGVQAAAPRLQDEFRFDDGPEEGTVNARYPAKEAVLFDGGFAVRLRSRVRTGVAVSYSAAAGAASVEAGLPHPFLFNRLRPVEGTSSKLDRKELGVHAQLQYVMPLTGRLHAVLAGGPTYFRVEQQLVDAVQFDHEYPYDTATFRSTTSRRARGSGVGFNAGADVVWTFSRRAGLGGSVRYARGSVDLGASGGRDVTADAGGVQGGLGLRVFF